MLPRSEGEGQLGARACTPRGCAIRCTGAEADQQAGSSNEAEGADLSPSMPGIVADRHGGTVADLVPGRRTARRRGGWCAGSSTRSPPITPPSAELLEFCREELARMEEFCREREMIRLPANRWKFSGRRLVRPSAGPSSTRRGRSNPRRRPSSDRPVPKGAGEREESYLRGDNGKMLRLIAIHEAVPGHYLQGSARRATSLPRTIFGSRCSTRARACW